MTGSCSDKRRLNTGFPFGKDRVLDWPSLDQFARNGKQTICLPVGTFRAPRRDIKCAENLLLETKI
jgi:hypothetical protein